MATIYERVYWELINASKPMTARQIAERQGGYVKLDSAPDRGCRFSLYLPRE